MNDNMFRKSSVNDNDSKRIQDIIGRNQTRKISPSFSYGENNFVQESEVNHEQPSLAEKFETKVASTALTATTGGAVNGEAADIVAKAVVKRQRKKRIVIVSLIVLISFVFIILFSMLGAGENDRVVSKDLLKKFSSVTTDNDSAQIDDDLIDTEFPPIGDTPFKYYFEQHIKDYLIEYLSQNGYCDNKACDRTDAYVFFKRYLEVLIAFEQKDYKIDSGLLYETIAYERSDEEMFSGSTKVSTTTTGWFSFIKSLFDYKTDEISKLANKFWRKIYIFDEEGNKTDETEWVFSLDKYVAYLMYGDSMNDTSGLGTNDDLNIEATSIADKSKDGNVVSGNHTYKYSGCTASDSIYEGVIEKGYIYNRFKDTPLLNNLKDSKKIEAKIVWIIQQIFKKTVQMYGNPNYCSGYSGGTSTYGTNICTYQVGSKTYSDLKVQLYTCQKLWKDAKPIEGEELVDFEKYITGVVSQENGNGGIEALKVQAITARSFALKAGKMATLSDGTQVLKIRNCTYDQVYCDPDKGCWSNVPGGQTKEEEDIAYNLNATIHSGYDASKVWSKKPLDEDSKIRQAVNDVAGELLIDSNGEIIKTTYNSTAQQAWNKAAEEGKDYVSILLSHYNTANDINKGECESVGATVSGIARSERMKYLFPNGVPTTELQMKQYLTTIEVPINNEKGQKTTMNLTVHKKLAANFKQAFIEIQKTGFKIKKSSTAAYNWRKMATDSTKQSYHSYGTVVDVNWIDNPLVNIGQYSNYKPGINEYSVTQQVVNIFKKNGFYWGGDWTSYKDYMHFTYTNN